MLDYHNKKIQKHSSYQENQIIIFLKGNTINKTIEINCWSTFNVYFML